MLSDIEELQNDDALTTPATTPHQTPLQSPAPGLVNDAFDLDDEEDKTTPKEKEEDEEEPGKIIHPEGTVVCTD